MAQDVWFGGYNHNTSDSEVRFLMFCHNVFTSTENLQLTTPDGQRDSSKIIITVLLLEYGKCLPMPDSFILQWGSE